jgi:hypothetical protein
MSDHQCEARQYSSSMVCNRCNQTWDMNDPYEPACKPFYLQQSATYTTLTKELYSSTYWQGVLFGSSMATIIMVTLFVVLFDYT